MVTIENIDGEVAKVFDGANFDAPDFTNTFFENVTSYGGGHHIHFRGY